MAVVMAVVAQEERATLVEERIRVGQDQEDRDWDVVSTNALLMTGAVGWCSTTITALATTRRKRSGSVNTREGNGNGNGNGSGNNSGNGSGDGNGSGNGSGNSKTMATLRWKR